MAKNNSYWKQRFEQLEEAQLIKGEEYYKQLDKEYRKAINDIESQMARWYGRIADNNGIGMAEAKKWLKGKELEEFNWNLDEYIKYGRENAINGIWMKELENASARVHISRLEALEIQLRQTVESLYQNQHNGLSDTLKAIYEGGYYHSAFEIQRGLNVGWTIPALDSNRLTQVLSKPWTADGSNFSDRIWKAKGDLVNTLHTELTQSIIMGRAPDKAIKRIADKFNTSRTRAGRLVMTESAFFASASQRDCFNDLGVEKYEICATLDSRTSEICQDLDGKVFKMSEYEPGLTAPPFHCWCRTTTIPYFDDNFGERIARDESGRQFYVPDDMTFKEWYKEYVKRPEVDKELKKLQKVKPPKKERHVLTSLGKNSTAKNTNTIIMPGVDYLADIECIQKGLYNKVNGMYVVGNRTYTYHDNIFHPVDGDGFITLNRGEYGWLVKIKTEKNNPNLQNILYNMGAKDTDIERMKDILRKGGIL